MKIKMNLKKLFLCGASTVIVATQAYPVSFSNIYFDDMNACNSFRQTLGQIIDHSCYQAVSACRSGNFSVAGQVHTVELQSSEIHIGNPQSGCSMGSISFQNMTDCQAVANNVQQLSTDSTTVSPSCAPYAPDNIPALMTVSVSGSWD
jgi:hypothetical protein